MPESTELAGWAQSLRVERWLQPGLTADAIPRQAYQLASASRTLWFRAGRVCERSQFPSPHPWGEALQAQ